MSTVENGGYDCLIFVDIVMSTVENGGYDCLLLGSGRVLMKIVFASLK